MKIELIYSRFTQNGKHYIIALVNSHGEFTIGQIRLPESKFKTVREGDVL